MKGYRVEDVMLWFVALFVFVGIAVGALVVVLGR